MPEDLFRKTGVIYKAFAIFVEQASSFIKLMTRLRIPSAINLSFQQMYYLFKHHEWTNESVKIQVCEQQI